MTERCFGVTGVSGAGKTRALQALVQEARRLGHSVAGFVQPRVPQPEGRWPYEVLALDTGERARVASFGASGVTLWPEGFALGQAALARALSAELVVVDELGHAEARGEGHWPALAARLKATPEAVFVLSLASVRVAEIQPKLPGLCLVGLDQVGMVLKALKSADSRWSSQNA